MWAPVGDDEVRRGPAAAATSDLRQEAPHGARAAHSPHTLGRNGTPGMDAH